MTYHTTWIAAALFTAIISLSAATPLPSSKQVITFTGLNKKEGKLYIGWYANAEGFREPGKAVIENVVSVKGVDSQPVVFSNVRAGTYAIAVFFDQNGNGKMDLNVLGIPKEKYGFSNNVFPLTRAATFKEAAFKVTDEDGTLSIRLK